MLADIAAVEKKTGISNNFQGVRPPPKHPLSKNRFRHLLPRSKHKTDSPLSNCSAKTPIPLQPALPNAPSSPSTPISKTNSTTPCFPSPASPNASSAAITTSSFQHLHARLPRHRNPAFPHPLPLLTLVLCPTSFYRIMWTPNSTPMQRRCGGRPAHRSVRRITSLTTNDN